MKKVIVTIPCEDKEVESTFISLRERLAYSVYFDKVDIKVEDFSPAEEREHYVFKSVQTLEEDLFNEEFIPLLNKYYDGHYVITNIKEYNAVLEHYTQKKLSDKEAKKFFNAVEIASNKIIKELTAE